VSLAPRASAPFDGIFSRMWTSPYWLDSVFNAPTPF